MSILNQRIQLYLAARHDKMLQQLLLERCRRDVVYWFNTFCWTFDPRQKIPHMPFVLYPYQHKFLLTLCESIETGRDLLVEKSRDMGLSWLSLLTFQYYWLFVSGSNFHLGSRKLEYVDRKGDISTLFEKLRYNLFWLPDWMKPEGYSPQRHDSLYKLINPTNTNIITGESSNENFARGGRYKAILFDEFPFWQSDTEAYAAAGQSSPCRILIGTPYGKNNKFAQLRFYSEIEVATIHWKEHPDKDQHWYKKQQSRMTEDELARELDINYHLSVQDRVFKSFSEHHKKSLIALEGKRILRVWDFGYHCPACLLIQKDDHGRVLVLKEVLGHQVLLIDFARQVLDICEAVYPSHFEAGAFEDLCDPAGAQRSDKHIKTSIEILNSLKIYPFYQRVGIRDGIERIRMKLKNNELTNTSDLLIDFEACPKLIEAFDGGYRYPGNGSELPVEEHPYEDVMDCLRYAVTYLCPVSKPNSKKPVDYRPDNPYTGY